MAEVKGFKGFRYSKKIDLDSVICPPYDIISDEEREQLYKKNPCNIIRVEFGKEYPDDDQNNNKWIRAKQCLEKWINEGILVQDDKNSVYILEQQFEVEGIEYKRTGIILLLRLVDFSEGIVVPHEFTLSKPKQDRLNLLSETKANISSIYGLYEKDINIEGILNEIKKKDVCISYNGLGTKEKMWIEQDEDLINNLIQLFKDKKIFIADGHHRYETALNYKKLMDEKCGENKEADYNYIMITLTSMDDPGIVILPTHRVIYNSAVDPNQFKALLKRNFIIKSGNFDSLYEELKEAKKYSFLIYLPEKEFILAKLKDKEILDKISGSKYYKNLDVVILQELILNEILKIDTEDLADQKSLKYTKSVSEAIAMVNNGANYAIILNPTLVDELKGVSLCGEKMPQKSTYFYPKLMTGNVMYVHKK